MASKKEKSDKIIYVAIPTAIAAAAIPLPVADAVAISAVQLGMLVSISAVYDKVINKNTLKGLMFAAGGAYAGIWLWSLVKAIPGIGTVTGIIGQMLIAGTVTAAIGLAFQSLTEKGLEINKKNFKKEYEIAKGKAAAMVKPMQDKIKKTEKIKKSVNFHAVSSNFIDQVTFKFNVSNYRKVKIRITSSEGELLKTKDIDPTKSSLKLSTKNYNDGDYFAFLDIDDYVPISIVISKG